MNVETEKETNKILFSEIFNVSSKILEEYGAVDISLVCDIPLFVDPLLIFNSEKDEYKKLHKKIIKYFHFLAVKAQGGLTKGEISAWFGFHEVKQNWLGYSLSGNGGLALGKKFSEFLANNIQFALTTNSISSGSHIEKIMLIYEGSGKDKISDLTVNVIKSYLLEYTEKFAKLYIDPSMLKTIPVDKADFNYQTETFVSKEYKLPYIINANGEMEYVLLTPFDILRKDEPAINRVDFCNSHQRIRNSIDNIALRSQVENYIGIAVKRYEDNQKKNKKRINEDSINKIEKRAFVEIANQFPILYDYYIKLRENDTNEVRNESYEEFATQFSKLIVNSKRIIKSFFENNYMFAEMPTAIEETKNRLKYFKHIIEDCDAYRNFYVNGENITCENDLQRMFKFVWYATTYKSDFETNNGRGPSDVIISKGQKNQCIVEFKLASNPQLPHIFSQVDIYKAANDTENSLYAIFFFSQAEYNKTMKIIKAAGQKEKIGETIFLIDCRSDNKPSASKVK